MSRETSDHALVEIGEVTEDKLLVLIEFAKTLPSQLGLSCLEKVSLCVTDNGAIAEVDGELSQTAEKVNQTKRPAKLFFKLKPGYQFYKTVDPNPVIGIEKIAADEVLDTSHHTTKLFLTLLAALEGEK